MNENIDLTKILKDCPIGTTLYSIDNGYVEFLRVDTKIGIYHIVVKIKYTGALDYYTKKGKANNFKDAECCLFPSKDQRDWSKFTAPWYKKERDTIAQLEEQGEQEEPQVYETEDGEIITYSETDGYKFVEPNFNEGDWVVRGDTIARIVNIQEQYYIGLDINGKDFVSSRFLNDDKIHLWTIQNAKDGDVLVNGSNIFIFHFINNRRLMGYCHVNMDDGHFYNDIGRNECFCTIDAPVTPSTKEQRDLLFQKMKEAGYKWTTETNTFEKLVEPKFDPKTLKPFDRVLARIGGGDAYCWFADFVSIPMIEKYDILPCIMSNKDVEMIIPYNEDTRHLVGTDEEAPEYYRYWED